LCSICCDVLVYPPIGLNDPSIYSSSRFSENGPSAPYSGVQCIRYDAFLLDPIICVDGAWNPGVFGIGMAIKLLKSQFIKQIGTRGSSNKLEWVTSYMLAYKISISPNTWIFYKENGQDKIFTGNVDSDSEVLNDLNVFMTDIRIHPWSANGNLIDMRIGTKTNTSTKYTNYQYVSQCQAS
jgi:hypothetical protein